MLLKNEAIVAGSDQSPSEAVSTLQRAGADITIGHDPDNLAPFAQNSLSNAR